MGIPIKRGIEAIPGGMVIVPLTLGALIATFAPGAGQFFGSVTGALFTGALPILAVFYVCLGAIIPFETLPQVAASVVVTMLTVPLSTAWWAKRLSS